MKCNDCNAEFFSNTELPYLYEEVIVGRDPIVLCPVCYKRETDRAAELKAICDDIWERSNSL